MTGQGSGGNVIAALCSFIFPGLGQLLQGRLFTAAVHFLLALILWWVFMGWIMHLWSAYSAARYVPPLVY
jgi:TM2 domain-containing membrane protein YozV